MNLFDDHINSCPAREKTQPTGRTQVGQKTEVVHSWIGWAPYSSHTQQATARSGPSEQAYMCVGGVQISPPNEGKKNVTENTVILSLNL